MLKKTMLIGMMCVSFLGISQTQCNGLTKDSVQCKNVVKDISSLCHLHNPNYVSKSETKSVVCSGITKKNKSCKNKTKNESGLCYRHEEN